MYTGNVRGMFFNSEKLRKAAKKSRRQKRVVALKNPANDAAVSLTNERRNEPYISQIWERGVGRNK